MGKTEKQKGLAIGIASPNPPFPKENDAVLFAVCHRCMGSSQTGNGHAEW
jgi:hypothetical protein